MTYRKSRASPFSCARLAATGLAIAMVLFLSAGLYIALSPPSTRLMTSPPPPPSDVTIQHRITLQATDGRFWFFTDSAYGDDVELHPDFAPFSLILTLTQSGSLVNIDMPAFGFEAMRYNAWEILNNGQPPLGGWDGFNPHKQGAFMVTVGGQLPPSFRHNNPLPLSIPVASFGADAPIYLHITNDGSLILGSYSPAHMDDLPRNYYLPYLSPIMKQSRIYTDIFKNHCPVQIRSSHVSYSTGAASSAPSSSGAYLLADHVTDLTQMELCMARAQELFFTNDAVAGTTASIWATNAAADENSMDLYVRVDTGANSVTTRVYTYAQTPNTARVYFKSAVVSINPRDTNIIRIAATIVMVDPGAPPCKRVGSGVDTTYRGNFLFSAYSLDAGNSWTSKIHTHESSIFREISVTRDHTINVVDDRTFRGISVLPRAIYDIYGNYWVVFAYESSALAGTSGAILMRLTSSGAAITTREFDTNVVHIVPAVMHISIVSGLYRESIIDDTPVQEYVTYIAITRLLTNVRAEYYDDVTTLLVTDEETVIEILNVRIHGLGDVETDLYGHLLYPRWMAHTRDMCSGVMDLNATHKEVRCIHESFVTLPQLTITPDGTVYLLGPYNGFDQGNYGQYYLIKWPSPTLRGLGIWDEVANMATPVFISNIGTGNFNTVSGGKPLPYLENPLSASLTPNEYENDGTNLGLLSLAVRGFDYDPVNGRLWIFYADMPAGAVFVGNYKLDATRSDYDVGLYAIYSENGGMTWSARIPVTDTNTRNRGTHSMSIDKTTGTKYFTWFDGAAQTGGRVQHHATSLA